MFPSKHTKKLVCHMFLPSDPSIESWAEGPCSCSMSIAPEATIGSKSPWIYMSADWKTNLVILNMWYLNEKKDISLGVDNSFKFIAKDLFFKIYTIGGADWWPWKIEV